MKCPVCKNDFNPHTGRRPKKFCSDACKVKYFNAQKKVIENNKPENKQRIEEERNTVADHSKHNNSLPNEDVQSKLTEYENELRKLADTSLGRQRKRFVERRISELKKQL